MRQVRTALLAVFITAPALAQSRPLIYSPEGNRLRRYDIATIDRPPLREDVLIDRAGAGGRDVNGPVCLLPDGSGRFIMGEDTGQPTIPPGWGVFEADGTQVGKLTATYFVEPEGDPYGCSFDSQGRLFTGEIGNDATGPLNGQLILWFPPFDRFPGATGTYPNTEASTNFCKIASNIGTATGVAIDEQDRVYIASARTGTVLRFSPPFPTSPDAAGGCGGTDSLGSPVADSVQVETFISDRDNVPTPTSLARAANGNWYVSSVFNGTIGEYDSNGVLVQLVLHPPDDESGFPLSVGHPQGVAVDDDGNLYYADLQLTFSTRGIGPGPNGKVRRIRFVKGEPQPPEIVREGLAFPDAVTIVSGHLDLCYGDCNHDGKVAIEELIRGVDIALDDRPVDECELLDADFDGKASIDELVTSVGKALHGCPVLPEGGDE